MHNRLVRLVLKVTLPALHKITRGPTLHLRQFAFTGSDLDARVNAIRGQGACALDVPLLIDLLLRLMVPTSEIIKRFHVRLGPVDIER